METEEIGSKDFWTRLNYFSPDEFDTKDINDVPIPNSGRDNMNKDFVIRLEKARKIAGIPFVITSGYRNKEHNRREGGTEDSAHLTGYAVDIRATNSRERFLILSALFSVRFNRIGINFKKGFIHVDSDPTKSKEVVWGY